MASDQAQTSFHVMYQGQPIGSSLLEYRDTGMAVAFGRFNPLPAYELVRDIFLMFTDAQGETRERTDQAKLAAYFKARDALNLALVTSDRVFLSSSWIHIIDWGELGREVGEPTEVQAQIDDATFWRKERGE